MNKETFEKRRAMYIQQQTNALQVKANLLKKADKQETDIQRIEGCIKECEYWIDQFTTLEEQENNEGQNLEKVD